MATRLYVARSTSLIYEYREGIVRPKGTSTWKENNPYTHNRSAVVYRAGDNYAVTPRDSWTDFAPSTTDYNRLFSKVADKVNGSQGALLTAAMEWRSSLEMVTNRAIQLRRAYNALRSGNPLKAGKLLGMEPREAKRAQKRIKDRKIITPESAWLEYWMGWAPTMGDIFNAIDVLQRPYPDQKFRTGHSFYTPIPDLIVGTPSGASYSRKHREGKGHIAAYGRFKISNPNLYRANQLGLVNPAQTAWEIVPFSFVADWFTNVGQVLGSLTTFAGVTLSDTGYGTTRSGNVSRQGFNTIYENGVPRKKYFREVVEFNNKSRSPSPLVTPRLTLELPNISLTRAATAISLLSSIFLRKG